MKHSAERGTIYWSMPGTEITGFISESERDTLGFAGKDIVAATGECPGFRAEVCEVARVEGSPELKKYLQIYGGILAKICLPMPSKYSSKDISLISGLRIDHSYTTYPIRTDSRGSASCWASNATSLLFRAM